MSTLARNLRLTDRFGITGLGIVLSAVFGVTASILTLGIAITIASRSYGRTTCANWSGETGIKTKFVVLNWASGGSCLARTPDGRWVLNSNWQAFVQGSK